MNLQQTIEAARNVMRFQHKSYRTEQAYVGWITRFAHWCRSHPGGAAGVTSPLENLKLAA